MSALQQIRETRKMRREELAMAAGISADYVLKLEKGSRKLPNVQVAQALAKALGVRVEDIWPLDPDTSDNEPAAAEVR